jgi:hypothetical protein
VAKPKASIGATVDRLLKTGVSDIVIVRDPATGDVRLITQEDNGETPPLVPLMFAAQMVLARSIQCSRERYAEAGELLVRAKLFIESRAESVRLMYPDGSSTWCCLTAVDAALCTARDMLQDARNEDWVVTHPPDNAGVAEDDGSGDAGDGDEDGVV